MQNFLAVDTSGSYLTVVAVKNGKAFSSFIENCAMKQSTLLMSAVDEVLKKADLSLSECDFFASVVGAGSFTGIRIGISAVKGFCSACNKPSLPITSFDVAAYNGIDTQGKILCLVDALHDCYYACGYEQGKVCFEPDTLETFICASVPSLSGLIKFANLTGGLDVLCRIVNGFAKKYEEKIYDETLIPTFASLPGFWSMMQADYYEEARQFIFEGKEEQYAGLLTRLDAFYNNVASKREEILASAVDGGMKLVILACYNTPIAPVYEHAKYQSDGVVETSPMSGGAITSVVGSTLTDEQLAVGDSKYVSADKCINASTCLYRDYTWFMKNAGHVVGAYGSDCVYFLFELLESEEQPTINTWSKYPQFMLSDGNETLAPLT